MKLDAKRLLIVLFSSITLVPFANAVVIPGIVENTLRSVFLYVPEIYVFKFCYFIIMFALLYWSAKSFVFKEKGNIATAISFIIALAAALLTPNSLVTTIFTVYSILTALILLVGPIFGFLYMGSTMFKEGDNYTRFGRGFRAIVFGLASYFFGMVPKVVEPLGIDFLGISPDILSISDVFYVASFVFFILAIMNLFFALFGGGGTVGGGSWPFKGGGDSGGGSGKGGGDSDDDDSPSSPKKKKKKKEEEEEDDGDGKNKLPPKGTYDPSNPGYVRVQVVDLDDNPIQGAQVIIKPANATFGISKYTIKKNTTQDGFMPTRNTYEPCGSGWVKIKVVHRKYKRYNWFIRIVTLGVKNNIKRYREKSAVPILPGEKQVFRFVMQLKGEPERWFEPKVLQINRKNVKDAKDNDQDGLEFVWRIDP